MGRRWGFRVKLALISTVISGIVLIAVCSAFWVFMRHLYLDRTDRELADVASHLVIAGHGSLAGLHLAESPVAFYGEELHGLATALEDDGRGLVERSDNWPDDLTASDLPRSAKPVPAGHGGGQHVEYTDLHHDPHAGPPRVEPTYATTERNARRWRLAALRQGGRTLHLALDLRGQQAVLDHIGHVLLLTVVLALMISAAGGWFLAGRALRPVRRLTEAATEITAADLDRRLDPCGADREFARLITVFNGMLERLERSFGQAVRFSADASHELKTPLTILQGEVEAALQAAPAGGEIQRVLASQLEEIQRLKRLVRQLLLLSHADSGSLRPGHEAVDLSALFRETCEDIRALSPDLRVDLDLAPDVTVPGDGVLLRQVLLNLTSNSVRHNEPGGWVRCRLARSGDRAVVSVANSGPRIPSGDRERIFDRFFRVADSRQGEGVGLGLSLALEIARAHGGDLELVDSTDEGTEFRLVLPG